jgi:hypothetical protein
MEEVLELIDANVLFNWNTLKNPSKLACNQFKGISKAFIRG